MINKFKAYNESEGKMSKPFSMPHMLLNFTGEDGLGLMKTLTDEIIVQFTGLQDKNGVDIYEGDILRNESGRLGVVLWFWPSAQWDVTCVGATMDNTSHGMSCNMWKFCVEIAGNNHQNTELL